MTSRYLYIICEGQTEETFVNELLYPHFFNEFDTITKPLLLPNRKGAKKRSHKGGWLKYDTARSYIRELMNQQHRSNTWFSTLLDLYGIPDDFPDLAAAPANNAAERVAFLEDRFCSDIVTDSAWRFTPYLQLHEFETLLFVDLEKLVPSFPNYKSQIENLKKEVHGLVPEDINDDPKTAPSKRIIKFIPEYSGQKVSVGASVAAKIGIDALRQGCPHFDKWIGQLENCIETHCAA